MVQIHSPRPFLLEPVIYRQIAADRLVSNQEVDGLNRIAPTTLFSVLSQIYIATA